METKIFRQSQSSDNEVKSPVAHMKLSDKRFEEALKLIPWGTQTNAKRPFPQFDDTMPKFIERGKGCRIWDMEGKEYIDFRLALGPVTLGYCYDEVDDAVRAQMKKGVLFSMASPLELELAQLLHETVPNAEMVRFMKTGKTPISATYASQEHTRSAIWFSRAATMVILIGLLSTRVRRTACRRF